MKKKIELSGRVLEYELERKKVKNINLRINPKGVFVSAGRAVPQSRIDAFLRDKAEFIFEALDRFSSLPQFKPEDNVSISLLGKEYLLKIQSAQRNSYKLDGSVIYLHLSHNAMASKVLDRLFRAVAEKVVPERCALLCRSMGRDLPQINYRAMKSRWGSCTPSKNSICINSRLMAAPMECVDYVIAHELCHFLQANHSAAFYSELEKIIPDWKLRKKQLSQFGKYLQ